MTTKQQFITLIHSALLGIMILSFFETGCGDKSTNIRQAKAQPAGPASSPPIASVPTTGLVVNTPSPPPQTAVPVVTPSYQQPVSPSQPVVPVISPSQAQGVPSSPSSNGGLATPISPPVENKPISPSANQAGTIPPSGPNDVQPAVYPPGLAAAVIGRQGPCRGYCKERVIRLDLENPAPISRWFIIPAPHQSSVNVGGGISSVRTYRFLDGEAQIVMGEFEGSKSFRAILLPPSSKVILKNLHVDVPEGQKTPLPFEILVTTNIVIHPSPRETATTIDTWIAGGASSSMSKPQMQIDLGAIGGNNFEGLAGSIETQDHTERSVTFAEPVNHINLSLEGFH